MSLPGNAVYDKLIEDGFEHEDLMPRFEEIKGISSFESFYDKFTSDDVETRLMLASEFKDTQFEDKFEYLNWGPWTLLTLKPITGIIVLVIYREHLKLLREKFIDDWLEWKEKYNLSDEEWEDLGPSVGELMEDLAPPWEIDSFLAHYDAIKTPEGRERLYKYYKNMYRKTFRETEKEAERKAKDLVNSNRERGSKIPSRKYPAHIKARDLIEIYHKLDFIPFYD